MPEQARTKPRVSIVLAEDERVLGEQLRVATRESLSAFIGRLIREEAKRAKRRDGNHGSTPATRAIMRATEDAGGYEREGAP